MANDNLCIFCGQKLRGFRSIPISCGNTTQSACRDCARELKELDDAQRCRRALQRGLAYQADALRAHLALIDEAEAHRPACPSCGGKLRFRSEQRLDNSPHQDGIFSTTFDVIPACCPDCGRYEFYDPRIIRKNPSLAHLIQKDTTSF